MASTAPPIIGTDNDGDHRNISNNITTPLAAANSEGRSATNTTTTMAMQRQKNDKRSRRVSFAEMTSVHFFDRDEDNEMPSEGSAAKSTSEGLGFKKLDDSRDNEVGGDNNRDEGSDENDDDEDVVRRSFFRPIESPSPGSNIGSATSNDEDNFFGPVSASFIRPGRLSDSAASDENHDITMDSTAFSMHFRSLARSDSGVDIKTPTGVHFSFEEKTPTRTASGSSMALTIAKKQIFQSAGPVTNVSGSSDSSDMSLVGQDPHRYDYERLSPALDQLLAEGKDNLHVISGSGNTAAPKSPRITGNKLLQPTEKGNGLVELNINQKQEFCGLKTDEVPQNRLDDANDDPRASTSSRANNLSASSRLDTQASNPNSTRSPQASNPNSTRSPNQDKSVSNSKNSVEESASLFQSGEFSELSRGALQKLGQSDGFMQHECESPLQDLKSSSPAKQKQSSMNIVTPSRYTLMVTPLQDKNIKHHGSESSIQKSISRLEKLHAAAISSYLSAKVNNSYIRSVELSKTFQSNSILDGKNYNEKQLLSVPHKGEGRSAIADDNGIEAPNLHRDVDHSEGSLNLLDTGTYQSEQLMKPMPSASSPSQSTFPGKRRGDIQFDPKVHTENLMGTFGIGSSSAEIILDNIGEEKVIDSSLDKRLGKDNQFPRGENSASKRSSVDMQLMNATAGNSSAEFLGRTVQVSSPVIEHNGTRCFTGENKEFDGEVILHDQQDLLGSAEKFRSPFRHEESETVRSISLRGNPRSRASLSRSRSNFSVGESRADVTYLNDSRLRKNLLECFDRSPLGKEQHESRDDASFHPSINENLASPKSNQLMDMFWNSSTCKRRNQDVVIRDRERGDEDILVWRSPKLQKVVGPNGEIQRGAPMKGCEHRAEDILIQKSPELQKVVGPSAEASGCPSGIQRGAVMNGHELERWSDIYSKFLEDAERFLSPAFEKLNLHAIDVMDDILAKLQRSKTYGILCDGLLLQRTSDDCDFDYGRILETRLLLHRILYEQAKSYLMRVKRGKLQEKVQQLSSRLQKMQMLKSSSLLQQSDKCPRVDLADSVRLRSLPVRNKDKKEVPRDKVTAMAQSLEASDRKISNLIKTLLISCKIKGEHSCGDTIALVNDHLMKRTCLRFVRLDMQMWVVQNVERRNGRQVLILNYFGFISQRLTVTVGPVSSIVIMNEPNDVDISKKFPNMDACTAFRFVLNTESTRKYVGVRSLAHETQVTSSLLNNLLDVVREVQLAQIELQNLTKTSFHSQSAEQLVLQLCFFNFKSGRKLTFTLDISCLKRGFYPSDTFPSELAAADDVNEALFLEHIVNEIRVAVKNLTAGYMRVFHLCRCISHVVQASGG